MIIQSLQVARAVTLVPMSGKHGKSVVRAGRWIERLIGAPGTWDDVAQWGVILRVPFALLVHPSIREAVAGMSDWLLVMIGIVVPLSAIRVIGGNARKRIAEINERKRREIAKIKERERLRREVERILRKLTQSPPTAKHWAEAELERIRREAGE